MKTRAAAIYVAIFVLTAAFRFLALKNGFVNDHFVYISGGQQVLFGEWPTRGFIDPGLPLMFVAMGFPGLQTPDARVMRALSVLPGTSPTVMTARLVLSDVAAWEVVVAIGLMVLAIMFLRRVAGKIFAANILLTGKELSWRELWRGLKRA